MRTRPRPIWRHAYADDPAAPGTCAACHLPDARRANERHRLDHLPDTRDEMDEHRRRAGLDDTESESSE